MLAGQSSRVICLIRNYLRPRWAYSPMGTVRVCKKTGIVERRYKILNLKRKLVRRVWERVGVDSLKPCANPGIVPAGMRIRAAQSAL